MTIFQETRLAMGDDRAMTIHEDGALVKGLVDTLVHPLLVTNEQHTICFANSAASKALGRPVARLVGCLIDSILPGASCFELATSPLQNHWFTSKAHNADDEQSVFRVLATPFLAEGQKYCSIALLPSTSADVQSADGTLALIKHLIEGFSDPIYIKDAAGRYVLVNSALSSLTGLSNEQVVGRDDIDLFGPEVGDRMRDADRRIIASGIPQTYEESIHARDYKRQFLTTKVPYIDGDSNVRGLMGIARDITPYKWAEASSRNNERYIRQILDSVGMGVAVLAPDGMVREVNQASLLTMQMAGWEQSDLLHKPIEETPWWPASPEQQAQLRQLIASAARGERLAPIDIQLSSAAGPLDFEFTIAPMPDASGEVGCLIASAMDITSRRRAERRAQEQQVALAHLDRLRSISHLASGLAHELNQPLGAISNYAGAIGEMLGQGKASTDILRETLLDISLEARRAGQIIARLRSFVRKQKPSVEPTDPAALLQGAAQLMQFRMRSAGVAPDIHLAAGLPHVMADVVQIQQVLVNIVSNALDAMTSTAPTDRRLRLTAGAAPHGRLAIDVSDSGPGVPPDRLAGIFDLFYTTKSQGTGLGLALCKTIVEDHGGTILAAGNQWGGLTVTFTLPTEQASFEE